MQPPCMKSWQGSHCINSHFLRWLYEVTEQRLQLTYEMDSLTRHWWDESSKARQSNTQTRQLKSQFILLVQIHLAVSLFSATLLQEKMRMSQMISNVWIHDLQENSRNVTVAWGSNRLLFGVPAGSNSKNLPEALTLFPRFTCGFAKMIRKR